MALKRDQLLAKRKELTEKVEKNNNEIAERDGKYKCARCYEGFGMVNTMGEGVLVLAAVDLKEKSDMSLLNAAAVELGFEEFKNNTVYGYAPEDWMHDFKNRAAIIRLARENEKIEEALDIIERNLSEDDKFALEMDALAELIGE